MWEALGESPKTSTIEREQGEEECCGAKREYY